ncbi:hypothetical protein CEXT_554991 [Caerostris extrusa]|uniref:Uncharacterized protein n=1 Tax=Caerostris extrusa TaxID=172846 RepID=A0AAV4N727_CAEEX|nr:hypothetical protein CEXT_554991 [Caerostris extrusa]
MTNKSICLLSWFIRGGGWGARTAGECRGRVWALVLFLMGVGPDGPIGPASCLHASLSLSLIQTKDISAASKLFPQHNFYHHHHHHNLHHHPKILLLSLPCQQHYHNLVLDLKSCFPAKHYPSSLHLLLRKTVFLHNSRHHHHS